MDRHEVGGHVYCAHVLPERPDSGAIVSSTTGPRCKLHHHGRKTVIGANGVLRIIKGYAPKIRRIAIRVNFRTQALPQAPLPPQAYPLR